MTFPFGEPVTVHRLSGRTRDGDGNTVPAFTDADYKRVSVYPRFSQEMSDGSRDTTVIGYTLRFFPAIELDASDEVTVRGERCLVDGRPQQTNNPFTGTRMTRAVLRFVEG